jgi:hypothetical protein
MDKRALAAIQPKPVVDAGESDGVRNDPVTQSPPLTFQTTIHVEYPVTTPRRDFLSMLGAGGLAAAAPFDLPEMDGGGDPYVKSDKWDMTWIKRVKGKARGVFDITTTDSNGGWGRVTTWQDHAIEVYGRTKEVNAVAVIRHAAIALAMNDAYWDEFKPGQGRGGRGAAAADSAAAPVSAPATPAASLRNPIGSPKPGATDVQKAHTIAGFLAAGGIVLACNIAFSGPRSQIGRAKGLTGDAADKAARAYLIPGVILMPSGVFALIAAQQAGCGMCAALVPSMTGAS